MDRTLGLVKEFHDAFEIATLDEPSVPGLDPLIAAHLTTYGERMEILGKDLMTAAALNGKSVPLLRLQLIQEELGELALAMAKGDIVECLDALADLRYVLDGTTLALGLQHHFDRAIDEVHRSNLSKLENGKPVKNEAGRVVKGKDYSKPNLRKVLGHES